MAEEILELLDELSETRVCVKVESARLVRDDDTKLPLLLWQLRHIEGGGLFWRRQLFTPDQMPVIKKNLALCGIVCSNEELPSQLVKAKDCELEVELEENNLRFLRRLDENVFAGVIERQNVAEEIPL